MSSRRLSACLIAFSLSLLIPRPVQAHPDQDAAAQARLSSAYEAVQSLGDPGAERPPVLGWFEYGLGQGSVETWALEELAELDARLGQYEAARLDLARAAAADGKPSARGHAIASLIALLQGHFAAARSEAARADSGEAQALLARAEAAASDPEPEICLQPFAGLRALPPAQLIACAKATRPGDPLLETYLYALGRNGNSQHVSVLAPYLASKETQRAALAALEPLLSPGQLGLISPYFAETLALRTAEQVLRRHPLEITPALQSQLLPGLLRRVYTPDMALSRLTALIDLIGALRAPQAKAPLQKLAAFARELEGDGRISRGNPLWDHEQDWYSEERNSSGWLIGDHVARALAAYTRTPLMLAAAEGDLARVRQELAKKANPNARTSSGDSALSLAIANHHPEAVALLLAQGARPALPGPGELPPLIQAARAGQLAIVQQLLAKGADPDVSYEDAGLLEAAIDGGNADLVAWLVQRTGGLKPSSGEGQPEGLQLAVRSRQREVVARLLALAPKQELSGALDEAIEQDQAEILTLLLDQGVRFTGPADASPLLIKAIDRGRPELMRLLLARGASPETVSEGRSALLNAAGMHEPIYVELLLAHGAAPDRVGPEGETALTVAARNGNLPIVQRLIEKGASLRPPGASSPLAVADAYKTEVIEYLLAKGAPIAELKPNLGPLLMTAARRGQVALVQRLLSLGPTPAELGEALLYAASDDARETIPLLVSKGAAIDYREDNGDTPLFKAISRREGGHATVALLLELGANVNARQPDGTTPLMYAVQSGTLEQVRILIEKGADRKAKNQAGQTALDLTKAPSDEEVGKIAAYLRSLK